MSELELDGRFHLMDRLGSGAMGAVYRAYDVRREEKVALKLLRARDPSALYRFKKEFRSLAGVVHPNLVQLHELVATGGQWFFTMEIVAGENFIEHVRPAADGPGELDLGRLTAALRQLVRGVRALHDAGKLHRDLKPSNVMVTGEGRLVILDFGMVTELAPDLQSVDAGLTGTVAYMAPEQAAVAGASAASDWYAVGVILYQALTGSLPFTGSLYDVLREKQETRAPSPSERVAGLPPELVDLCDRLLAVEPELRPAGAEIASLLGGEPGAVAPGLEDGGPEVGLVGRETQLAELEEVFLATRRGRATAAYVHGASGTGKTALIEGFLASITGGRRPSADLRQGVLVLRGRCHERENVPFKALDGVVDSLSSRLAALEDRQVEELLPADVGALTLLFPVLQRIYPLSDLSRRPGSQDPLTLRRRAFAALRELLDRLARRLPLVLFIDALHWAEADSTALLGDLLRPPSPPPLMLLASFRSEEIERRPFLRELLAETGIADRREIVLGALADADVRRLAAALLGGADPAVLEAVVQEAHGSPFLVEQLARYLRVERDLGSGISLGDLVAARLRRLGPAAGALTATLAVANRPVDAAIAYEAAGLEGDERPLSATLRAALLVRAAGAARLEIYHDGLRQALVARLGEAEVRRIHGRLAATLERRGIDDPESLFEHRLGAGDREAAAGLAPAAAEHAFAALAFDRAARFYRQALELAPAAAGRGALLGGLARALANAGRTAEAAAAYLELAEQAEEAPALEARCRAAEQYLMSGDLERGLAVARVVQQAVGLELPQGPRRVLVSLLAHRLRLRLRGLGFEERAAEEVPARDLVRIDTSWALVGGLSLVDTVQSSALQARHLLLALAAGEPYRVARALAMEAGFLAVAGSPRRARKLLDEAFELARRVGDPHALGLATMQQGLLAYFEGRWRQAAANLDEAEAIFSERGGVVWERTMCRRFSLASLAYLGEMAELSRRVPSVLAEAAERGNTYLEGQVRSRLNIVWLAADDPAAGLRQLDGILVAGRGGFSVNRFNVLLARIQAALYSGDPEVAREALRADLPALERSLFLRTVMARVELLQARARVALALAADGVDVVRQLAWVRGAARRIERGKLPWWDALAALLRAGVAAVEGDRGRGVSFAKAAAAGFESADMALYAAAARRRQGEIQGDSALLDAADAWMRGQGIADPIRMTAMLAPGFPGRRAPKTAFPRGAWERG